jgi:trehalose 6-phosphate phosphatase
MAATRPGRRARKLSATDTSLFLDVDGTLLDLAPHPDAVEVAAGLRCDLAAVEHVLGGALALVSGRPISDLDRLFAPLRLRASGIHGAELRRRPDGPVASLVQGRLGDDWASALAPLLDRFPGSWAENKRVSIAVHYPRAGTDIAGLKHALSDLIGQMAAAGEPLKLVAGRAVFEIQLCGFDKGRAIERLMEETPFIGRKPIFVGDDDFDRAGFEAALALGGLAFSVGFERPGLSGTFSGPAAVRAWLHDLGR